MTREEFMDHVLRLSEGRLRPSVELLFVCNVDDYIEAGWYGARVKIPVGMGGGCVVVEPSPWIARGTMLDARVECCLEAGYASLTLCRCGTCVQATADAVMVKVEADAAVQAAARITLGDLYGRSIRAHESDAIAGCRLGCACSQHRQPREPYVPSVDEWDLLPDAK